MASQQDFQVMQQQVQQMMQRMMAMEGTIQNLMTENVQLKAHVQASKDGLQTAFTQQTAVLGELAEGIKRLGSKPQAAMLVDSRGYRKTISVSKCRGLVSSLV